MKKGLFIVLEGIDGAGTSTQAQMVTKQLRLRNHNVFQTFEPSDGRIGKLIREMIRDDGKNKPSWITMTLLFSADRLDHIEKTIYPNILTENHVICDRYHHSTLAYQSLSNEFSSVDFKPWIKEVGYFSVKPDITFILDIDPEVAAQRMMGRKKPKDVYENLELQRKLSKFYANIEQHFPDEKIVHIDGGWPVESITAEILQCICKLMEK